jgi:hypothetical protein
MSVARLLQTSAVLLAFAVLTSMMARESTSPVPAHQSVSSEEKDILAAPEGTRAARPPGRGAAGHGPEARESSRSQREPVGRAPDVAQSTPPAPPPAPPPARGDARDRPGGSGGKAPGGPPGGGPAQAGSSGDRPEPEHPSAGSRLAHDSALQLLRGAGITATSSGGCRSRRRPDCTSLDGIRRPVLRELIRLRYKSRCDIEVSGGTETGHAGGHFSHANGYKIDILPDECISDHIEGSYRFAGHRGDGAKTYKGSGDVTYFREIDHWDIMVR